MQFIKKTSSGGLFAIIKFIIKLILIVVVLFIGVVLLPRLIFQHQTKKIEKVIPNENFKLLNK